MTLFDYYLQYMQELFERKRPAPPGVVLTATDETARMQELGSMLANMGMANFVRVCAAQDGTVLPEEIFAEETPQETETVTEKDPDAGKHPFEVLVDCLALDDDLMAYLIQVLKTENRAEFSKLSQITTHMDLDPQEFLYWLGHREDYGTAEEAECAAVIDACLVRLKEEKRTEVVAALLSGDQKTFAAFRAEAPELRNRPEATWEWFSRNYLDRDYPLRAILRWNGVNV